MHKITEVIAREMCIGCGACGITSNGAIEVTINNLGMYKANLKNASSEMIEEASKICPMSDDSKDEEELANELFPFLLQDDFVGKYSKFFAGRDNREINLSDSSAGGLTSWLLEKLIVQNDIDGVIHVGASNTGPLFEYQVSYNLENLKNRKKSAYYSTSLVSVINSIKNDGLRYAIVGVPCFIKAVRLLASEDKKLAEQVVYFVGLVCGGMKSHFFAESLAWQQGIHPEELAKIDFRVKDMTSKSSDYSYETLKVGENIPLREKMANRSESNWGYGLFQPEACNFCDDIFAETADITFGDAWIPRFIDDPRGTNIVISRTEKFDKLLKYFGDKNEIFLQNITLDEILDSQRGNIRHRRYGLRIRLEDDLRRGLSVPKKRSQPILKEGNLKFKFLIRLRRKIGITSLFEFSLAKRNDSLEMYNKNISPRISLYKVIQNTGNPLLFISKVKIKATSILRR